MQQQAHLLGQGGQREETPKIKSQTTGGQPAQQQAHLLDQGGSCSREAFSDSALRALNISTTTSTVMATVLGALEAKASQALPRHCWACVSSLQLTLGPSCMRNM